ncbi:14921_t:CDS:2 [Acaulospora morrowiae]|uniref:14921_t:CDS:1 n=1 Tax=Acaulospora morrowiae TaxID=94023 RepID=A0A9N9HEC0_9GLOM|nr:14921_t:CDS:2 [Acaulospora morrowiae]
MSSSDKRGLNNLKNKSYLRGTLKELAKQSEDERVDKILNRIDKNLTPKNPQRPKEPNTRNWTRVHATPMTGSTTPKS